MSATKIEWTEKVWNPLRGCSRVSEGCRNCYAESVAARFSGPGQPYEGLARWADTNHIQRAPPRSPRWTGEVRLAEHKLTEPLRWRKPRMVFVNSMSDLFHEKVPDEWIDRIFAVMALSPQHTFQVLTKRPGRMLNYLSHETICPERQERIAAAAGRMVEEGDLAISAIAGPRSPWPLPNIWLGTSVEDQATADERIPLLLQTPAAVRWVSYEPALGPVGFDCSDNEAAESYLFGEHDVVPSDARLRAPQRTGRPGLDWIVVGGESGPNARPCDVVWIRSVIAQGREAKVPVFVKQLGARPQERDDFHDGTEACCSLGLRHPKGGDPAEWDEDLRVREWPR